MFKHLLVPTDGSELSLRAVAQAVGFAQELGARITFFFAIQPFPRLYSDLGAVFGVSALALFSEDAHAVAAKALDDAEKLAREAGVACEKLQLNCEEPYVGIIEAATTRQCDLILMASHGRRGIDAMLIGSETQKVLTHTSIPVLVSR